MKNAKLNTLICGLISISATVIFYLLTFDNIFTIPMRWVSLMLLLVAEVIGTLKAIFVNKNIKDTHRIGIVKMLSKVKR